MTHNVKMANNSAKTLSFELLNFFTAVAGHQSIVLAPEGVHECQAECCEAEAFQKFFFYCRDQGIDSGHAGLNVTIEIIQPTISE